MVWNKVINHIFTVVYGVVDIHVRFVFLLDLIAGFFTGMLFSSSLALTLSLWLSVAVHSYSAVCEFLQTNNLLSIIRAHEAQDAG